jgi:MFS family permease
MSLLSRTSPPHDRTAGRGRVLALLAAAMVLSMTTWFSASAVLPQLRAAWVLSPTEAAWLTIAVQLGFVTGALVSAVINLPDRVPARRVFFAASIGAAAVNGLVAACHGPATALPLRFATGCFVAGIYPPALKVMATWFRRGRGLALGVRRARSRPAAGRRGHAPAAGPARVRSHRARPRLSSRSRISS